MFSGFSLNGGRNMMSKIINHATDMFQTLSKLSNRVLLRSRVSHHVNAVPAAGRRPLAAVGEAAVIGGGAVHV